MRPPKGTGEPFNGVAVIVDEEDDRLQLVANKGRQILRCDLEGTIAHAQHHLAILTKSVVLNDHSWFFLL